MQNHKIIIKKERKRGKNTKRAMTASRIHEMSANVFWDV